MRISDWSSDVCSSDLVVAGKDGAERAELDLVTLIVASAAPPPSAAPEQAALLRLCTTPLSVAELPAYLSLPFSTIGRASCRERVCKHVYISGFAVSLKQKQIKNRRDHIMNSTI